MAAATRRSNSPRPRVDRALVWTFALFAFVAMAFEPAYYFPCRWRLDAEGPCGDPSTDGIVLALWRFYGRWDALFVVVPPFLRIMCTIEVFLFGPAYAVVAYYLHRGRDADAPAWFPAFALLFSGALIYSTLVYFAFEVLHEWDNDATSLPMVFLVNAPWSLAPAVLAWRIGELRSSAKID